MRIIMHDDIDLNIKDLNKLTFDSIYGTEDNKHTIVSHDSKSTDNKIANSKVYAIVTTSGKLINNREYDFESLRQNVLNKEWLKPYNRPFIKNHNLYNADAVGRISNTWLIDHSNHSVIKADGQEDLPTDVLKHFIDNGLLEEGTGSVIAELFVTEDSKNRIQNKLDMTVSQSSFMDKATCSICGKNYYGGDCTHYAGTTYKIENSDETFSDKLCYVKCSGRYEPIELSTVLLPANNTSLLYAPSKSNKNNKNSADSQEKHSEIDKNSIDNTIEPTEQNKKENNTIDSQNELEHSHVKDNKDMEGKMPKLKDILKNQMAKGMSDEIKKDFEALFDSLEKEEQIEALQKFLDSQAAEPTATSENEDELKEPKNENDDSVDSNADSQESETKKNEDSQNQESLKKESEAAQVEDKEDPEGEVADKIEDLKNIYSKEETKKEFTTFDKYLMANIAKLSKEK